MHPILLSKASSSSHRSARTAADPRHGLTLVPSPDSPANSRPLRVLSVGRMDDDTLLREALYHPFSISFTHAHDYRELWVLSRANTYHTVIFLDSLGCFELEEAARLVRQRWPSAGILLIRSGEITLDDPLYDQRLRPPVDPITLMSVLLRQPHLTGEGPPSRSPMGRWSRSLGS